MTAEAQTQPKALADLVRTLQGTVTDQPMKLDYQEVCEARQAFIEGILGYVAEYPEKYPDRFDRDGLFARASSGDREAIRQIVMGTVQAIIGGMTVQTLAGVHRTVRGRFDDDDIDVPDGDEADTDAAATVQAA